MAQDQYGSSRLPRLTQSRSGAARKIARRIRLGEEIRNREVRSFQDLDDARADRDRWFNYNSDLLLDIFDTRVLSDEYIIGVQWVTERRRLGRSTLDEWVEKFRRDTSESINRLESILERIKFFPPMDESQENERVFGADVFIVHGHDEAARLAVTDFLRRLELKPIVLQESGSGGRTIIENFEAHAENSGFAVILLTGDDTGYPGDHQDKAQARARQNVVLEFGYFLGYLGRERVRVLYKRGVEMPSDLQGVLYIEMDDSRGWETKLAREMKGAGFEVDMNLL